MGNSSNLPEPLAAPEPQDANVPNQLFESRIEAYCVIELIFDADGSVTDFRRVATSPTLIEQARRPVLGQGKRMKEFVPDFDQALLERYGRVAITGETLELNLAVTGLGNGPFHTAAFRVGGEGSHKVAVVFEKIADRERAEAEQQDTGAKYRSLIESIDEGFCIVEVIFDDSGKPVDYRFLEVNPAFERQTGLMDAPGKRMRELAPEHEEHWFDVYGQVARSGKPIRFELPAVQLHRWYDVYAWRHGDPNHRQVAILFNDITLRKRAEEALRDSEERFRALAMATSDVVYRMSPDWSRMDCLRGRDFIPDSEDPGGAWLHKNIHPEDQQYVTAAIDHAIRTRSRFELEHRVLRADGSLAWTFSRAIPILNAAGEIVEWFGAASDITARKTAETTLRETQKLESLGVLAGGVAHDFNNLLVGIVGNASLAQELLPPGHPAAELVLQVVKSGEQAAHLTRQMLAYSGKGRFMIEPLRLSVMIPEMVGLVQPSISRKVILRLDMPPDLPPIEADRRQVQQVFMNLTINAAEAIGAHEGLITVRAGVLVVDDAFVRLNPETQSLARGEYVFLEVRDTGPGIDESTKARIFDPFFTTKFTGRGLGLAAVAGIVRGHKGAVTVRSAAGQGSIFTVLFPMLPTAAEPLEAAPLTRNFADGSNRGCGR